MSKSALEFAIFCIEAVAQCLNVPGNQVYDMLAKQSDILNTYLMEITFEKKPKIEIPDDLPIKAVWMTGSATATQWNTPFKIAFQYNPDEEKGTFVWEGHLNTGEIKFPLSNTQGFECDYLMPKEDGTSVTEAEKMERKNYPDTTDENDHKWKVEEAGKYKISLNVIDMTVKFEKLQ